MGALFSLPETLAHAYIIQGPDARERLQLGMRLAARANCLASPEQRPCGDCENCRRIFQGTFEDWFYLEPQGAGQVIRISQVRQLQEDLSVRPRAGRLKVGVLDQAHRMQEVSQNCLLKTLEEPPADSLLLLLTQRPQDLLPTVRSRCQVLTAGGRAPEASREDLELAAEVVAAIRKEGLAAVFERAEFVHGSRKKELPAFFSALELLLRQALLAAWPGTAAVSHGWDGGGQALPEIGPLPPQASIAALEAVWQAGYLLDRNVTALLLLENLFLTLWQALGEPATERKQGR